MELELKAQEETIRLLGKEVARLNAKLYELKSGDRIYRPSTLKEIWIENKFKLAAISRGSGVSPQPIRSIMTDRGVQSASLEKLSIWTDEQINRH